MAIVMKETHESRKLHYGANGGGTSIIGFAFGSTDEAAIYAFALTYSPPTLNGFIRNDIQVDPLGGDCWKVAVEYGTTGQGGGDQPTGTTPTPPSGPADDTTPLTSGFSFSLTPFSTHITHSLATVFAMKPDGTDAPSFDGAIGVDEEGKVEGCDIPPAATFTFKRTVARATVTRGYLKTLRTLCGRTNDAPFYGFETCEVLYTGCDGQFTQGEGWSLTHTFGSEENVADVGLAGFEDIDIPKKGFEYLWVYYEWVIRDGKRIKVPAAAYVEQVLKSGDFAGLDIGT